MTWDDPLTITNGLLFAILFFLVRIDFKIREDDDDS